MKSLYFVELSVSLPLSLSPSLLFYTAEGCLQLVLKDRSRCLCGLMNPQGSNLRSLMIPVSQTNCHHSPSAATNLNLRKGEYTETQYFVTRMLCT